MKFKLNKHNSHAVIMMLCFIYGGISLMFFLSQIGPIIGSSRGLPSSINRDFEMLFNETCTDPENCSFPMRPNIVERFQMNISRSFFGIIFISLSGSIISIMAGTSLWILLKKKERKKLTKDIIDTMTTDEEKLIMRTLRENDNELTQSELVKRTNLSKVKVHRIVKRLESIGVVNKYSFGMTNKIRLNSNIDKKKPNP